MNYVLGFLFDDDFRRVVLIKKKHGPPSILGMWNGVGGKIDSCEEMPIEAMRREFREEAGVRVNNWTQFAIYTVSPEAIIHCFVGVNGRIMDGVRTVTDEEVDVFHTSFLPATVPNLAWLLPMAEAFARTPELGPLEICQLA